MIAQSDENILWSSKQCYGMNKNENERNEKEKLAWKFRHCIGSFPFSSLISVELSNIK